MQGAARLFEAGLPTQALVEMERAGLMFVMAISDGSSLTVLAAPECDTDLVSYEMAMLVEAVGDVLTRPHALGTGSERGARRRLRARRHAPLPVRDKKFLVRTGRGATIPDLDQLATGV